MADPMSLYLWTAAFVTDSVRGLGHPIQVTRKAGELVFEFPVTQPAESPVLYLYDDFRTLVATATFDYKLQPGDRVKVSINV